MNEHQKGCEDYERSMAGTAIDREYKRTSEALPQKICAAKKEKGRKRVQRVYN